jgi:hypothetical protein
VKQNNINGVVATSGPAVLNRNKPIRGQKKSRAQALPDLSGISMPGGIAFECFLGIAESLLCLTFDLLAESLGLLLLATDGFAEFALHFTGCILHRTLHLIFVHDEILAKSM